MWDSVIDMFTLMLQTTAEKVGLTINDVGLFASVLLGVITISIVFPKLSKIISLVGLIVITLYFINMFSI